MKKNIVFAAIISFLLPIFLASIVFAQFAGGTPVPGAIYKEFTFNHNSNNWRVTDPDIDLNRHPTAAQFLPNPILNLYVDDLQDAVKAEVVIDFWGGHVGTTNKRFRFNENDWIVIPELDTLGPCPSPGNMYMQQVNHLIEVPLSHLRTENNTFEGTSGPNSWGWGQWGWYGVVLRIYYNPDKPHATGQITAPVSNSAFSDNPTITVTTSGDVNKVVFLAYYDGYDTDGDGVFADYHRNYHRESWESPIGIRNHAGSDTNAPYEVTWDTDWLPDQAPGQIKLIARILDNNGYWYVTDEVTNLILQRTDFSVSLYRSTGVPEEFWVRDGNVKSSDVNIPDDLSSPDTTALMKVASWNGNDGSEDFYSKVNNWTVPKYGSNHFYSYDQITVPVSALKTGSNTFTIGSSTVHHGPEIMWPGPAILVRYGIGTSQPPVITSQPSDQSVSVGQTATFVVEATGTTPLNYQWRKNGANISGANSTVYTTSVATLSDDGSVFTCIVSNSEGSVTSDDAVLHVVDIYTAMSENFEDYPAGADPVDWLDTAANNSMLEDDSLFKVFDLSGNKVFGTTSTLANIHSHYMGAGIDTLSSYEYTGRMRMTSAGSGIGVTFFSEYPQADA
ncbi:MAG: immunoglobulin domain-containing protein, partial [Methanosarcinales archaeon]|nr:immunoglobulin domain-containing protein [Methanosarcinales archaeon]